MPGQTEEPFDYVEFYNRPGNAIRAYDEANGIRMIVGEDGVPRFAVDPSTLSSGGGLNGVPAFFQGRTFEHFHAEYYTHQVEARKALQTVRRYVIEFDEITRTHRGCGLYLWSLEKGSGKTFLASILGNALAEAGRYVRWYSMPELLREIRASFDSKEGVGRTIQRAQSAEVLILDDIGAEKISDWVNETLFAIVDERQKCCRPTVFTSNIAPDNLGYDGRIVDRIVSGTLDIHMPEERVRRLVSMASREKLRERLCGA